MQQIPRILVLEDNYLTSEALCDLMATLGYAVVGPVGDAGGALELLAQKGIDGAIVDIGLRGKMDFSVCRELQRLKVPFLILTGYNREVIPTAFLKHELLAKPVCLAELELALARLIDSGTASRSVAIEN